MQWRLAVSMHGAFTADDTDAAVAFCVLHRIDVLTGFFGKCEFVAELAKRSKAISCRPIYQVVTHIGSVWFHPTFYLFFGFYKAITASDAVPEFPADTLSLGADIWGEMRHAETLPTWQNNDVGSPYLNNLGSIKMKLPAWDRWFDGCFQTGPIYLGTSVQGRGARDRELGSTL